ncbi:MAG: hypothetical protein ACRD12_14595 [Acidimicrobiales bacterium]
MANGMANGFRGGNPFHGCMSVRGWITVCAAPRAVVGGFGVAKPRYVQNPTFHLDAMLVQICSDCGLLWTGDNLSDNIKKIVKHEFGHAIGLGEANAADGPSIMTVPATCLCTSEHDRRELTQRMYVNHDDTIYSHPLLNTLDGQNPGDSVQRNEFVLSISDRYRLVQQTDGNLVAYDLWEGRPYWALGTRGSNSRAVMQGDGNFVVYSGNAFLWASNTAGRDPGGRIVMQDDGNVVLYGYCCGPTWASGTRR